MHLNMSYSEVRGMPIIYRRWYIDRLSKHFKEQKESLGKGREGKATDMSSLNLYKDILDKKFE